MKAVYLILSGLAIVASTFAQDLSNTGENKQATDAVQKAIDEFNRLRKEGKAKDNEVLVVLDPPPAPIVKEKAKEDEESTAKAAPILVTGKPPKERNTKTEIEPEAEIEDSAEAAVEAEVIPDEPETPAEPKLEVRVESIRKGTGAVDPGQVKLKASFPPKPLSAAPNGWVLERSEQAPEFSKDVELQPGTTISLSIKPHILTPGTDGINTFSVGEPGFKTAEGYNQENTVSAILSKSVAQLDQDSLQLGNAISELHRLLASLPKPVETKKP